MRLCAAVIALGIGVATVGPSAQSAFAQNTPPPTSAKTSRVIDSLTLVVRGSAAVAVRATAATQLAEHLRLAGRDAEVLPMHREALALAVTSGDSSVLAQELHALGLEHWRRRQYDSALVHFDRTRTLRMLHNDSTGMGRLLNSIGASYYQLGMYDQALDAFTQALDLRRRQRDSLGVARTLTNIGKTYHDWGQYDRARRVFDEAITVAAKIDSQVPLGYALNSLASLDADVGELSAARAHLEQSRAAYQRASGYFTRSDSTSVWLLSAMVEATLRLHEGRLGKAVALLDSIRAESARIRDDNALAHALLMLGQAHRELGSFDRARRVLTTALEVSRRLGTRMLTLEVLSQRADLEEAAQSAPAALAALRAAQALRDTVFSQTAGNRIAAMETRAAIDRQLAENARLRRSITIGSSILLGALILLAIVAYYNRIVKQHSDQVEAANVELRTALSEVRTLKGLIPICSWCKKVRDDAGYWESVESYVTARSEALFSHGICQSCATSVFGADGAAAFGADAATQGDADDRRPAIS